MPRGYECPICGTATLQPYTTNQLRCTKCGTVVKREALAK